MPSGAGGLSRCGGAGAATSASASPSMHNFGLLLTGRLDLRNDFLSALAVWEEPGVWEERYFVLTRKALHYYVRAPGELTASDLFGKHDGSVALKSISHVQPATDAKRPLEFAIVTHGAKRNYTMRARNQESFRRWLSTLQAVLHGTIPMATSLERLHDASFANVPSLLDFRGHHTAQQRATAESVAYVALASARLGLHLLIGSSVDAAEELLLDSAAHWIDLRRDVLLIHLTSGGCASLPLATSLATKRAGSIVLELADPSACPRLRCTWRPRAPPPPARAAGGARAAAARVFRSQRAHAAAAVGGVAFFWQLSAALALALALFVGALALRSRRQGPDWPRAWTVSFAPTSEPVDSIAEGDADGAAEGVPRLESGEGELQMDAILAAVSSAEHSLLYDGMVAMREALRPLAARAEGVEPRPALPIKPLLLAMDVAVIKARAVRIPPTPTPRPCGLRAHPSGGPCRC